MPVQTDKPIDIFAPLSGPSTFAMNLLLSSALSETMKVVETIRLEGQQLFVDYKAAAGPAKEELKTAISLNIQDRKFLLATLFLHPLEKNV